VKAPRPRALLVCALSLTAGVLACRDHGPAAGPISEPVAEAKGLSPAVRDGALARARVWGRPSVPIEKADLSINTPGPGAFDADSDVECTFSVEPLHGSTPKFVCVTAAGERLKVKYGVPNGELPAEVAGTRLVAALGFFTDRMNRVKSVRCRGCPLLPQQALQCLERAEASAICLQGASDHTVVTFAPAVIERAIEGKKIEAADDQGWSFHELDRIDEKAGGSSRAQVDALRLVALVLAHWDNKGANQKLICPPGGTQPDGGCTAPLAAFGDLGGTFGPKKVDLGNWTRFPVWTDARACRVSMKALPFGGATFPDAQISEEGRQFALALLRPLRREQLDALFATSGVTTFPHVLAEAHQPRAWTDAFLDKVRQIEAAGPCPSNP
jgi:hypothetical protein